MVREQRVSREVQSIWNVKSRTFGEAWQRPQVWKLVPLLDPTRLGAEGVEEPRGMKTGRLVRLVGLRCSLVGGGRGEGLAGVFTVLEPK
ncbi:hypothetical protein E2C01_000189 [Portunus trituberculatus]|uniref:Uncharacterized protein n=1 Tax=Portunus trituberculatus TaxID=210409 RepID=A0A5B7CE99_PORTR|nr:hypothetical protein [Portunus trituberculatus]